MLNPDACDDETTNRGNEDLGIDSKMVRNDKIEVTNMKMEQDHHDEHNRSIETARLKMDSKNRTGMKKLKEI